MHRVADAGLELSGAQDADRALCGKDQQGAGNAPRFSTATASVEDFVAAGLEQAGEFLGEFCPSYGLFNVTHLA